MLYPFLLKPVFKEMIWGGNNLSKIFKKAADETKKVGESWEVCSHEAGTSIVINGKFEGKGLQELCETYKEELLGTDIYNKYKNYFPLLIKLIDAQDNLSIQVHPSDEYSMKNENEYGKTEMWYILHAEPGAKLVFGLKEGTTKDKFKKDLENKCLEECIETIDVKQGDCIFIPSGAVHAIMKGIVLIEVQQSSNITYRVYDWNRVDKNGNGRELHVNKALDVINFGVQEGGKVNIKEEVYNGYTKVELVKCEYFNASLYNLKEKLEVYNDGTSFKTFTVIEGAGKITFDSDTFDIKKGDSVLLPANVKETCLAGNMSVLLTEPVVNR